MNKYQEALDNLIIYIKENEADIASQRSKDLPMILAQNFHKHSHTLKQNVIELQELVDKSTPKKVVRHYIYAIKKQFWGSCPTCEKWATSSNSGNAKNYCGNCGQALDWSDT